MAHVGEWPQGRGRRSMLLRLTASSLALAATATVGAEGASAAGALPGSRSRPLRLVELVAEGQVLRGASRDAGAAASSSLSSGLRGMKQWHAAARRCRPSAARGTELHRLRGGADLGLMAPKPSLSKFTKLQNGLAASRASILWVIKGLLAAFTGLLTTSAVMVAFEFTAHKVRPITDLSEMMPDYLAGLVLAGAVVGSALGSWVLTKLSPSHPSVLALAVSSLFTAAQYMNLQVVAHPHWYRVMGLGSFIPPYLLISVLGSGGLSSATQRDSAKSLRFASPKKAASPRKIDPSKSVAAPTTPSTPKADRASDDKASKTPKSTTKASTKTPNKTPSKTPKTPKERKTPKNK